MAGSSQQAGRIVVLNGIGSVGKSFVAKALQALVTEPFLHVQMDAFLDMLPEAPTRTIPTHFPMKPSTKRANRWSPSRAARWASG
jgi:chloramphenicol 3-O-phosphotransferase